MLSPWFADRQHGGIWPLIFLGLIGGLGPSREPAGAHCAHFDMVPLSLISIHYGLG